MITSTFAPGANGPAMVVVVVELAAPVPVQFVPFGPAKLSALSNPAGI